MKNEKHKTEETTKPFYKNIWFYSSTLFWLTTILMAGAYQSASDHFYEMADLCKEHTHNMNSNFAKMAEISHLRVEIVETQCRLEIEQLKNYWGVFE